MLLWFIIWYRIPDQSKRLCVLASLYAQLTESTEDDVDRLAFINEELGLSRDTRSLRFPALIAPYIWRNAKCLKNINLDNPERYVQRLLRRTPCWLWYADKETRQHDIQRLLQLCGQDMDGTTRVA